MVRILSTVMATTVVAAALLSPLYPAYAAGPYDGTWTISMHGVGETDQRGDACPAQEFRVFITDNQVSARLARTTQGVTLRNVDNNFEGSSVAPLTGTVSPDGMLNAEWSGYHFTGKLDGNMGKLNVQRTCGPEPATATRVTQ
jgi:hypothetical protein